MPLFSGVGASSAERGLLRKSNKSQPKAQMTKPNDNAKPTDKESGSDTSSLDGRTLVEPQQGSKPEMVQPYLGRGRDANKLTRSDYKQAEKDTKATNPELYKQGIFQRRNADGDIIHEIRPGYKQSATGKVVKDDSYKGTASRHGTAATILTGGMSPAVASAYRKLRPRPQDMVDGGAAAKSQNIKMAAGLGALAVAGGGGYYFYTQSTGKQFFNPTANKQNPAGMPPGMLDPTQAAGYSGPPTQSTIGNGPVQIPPTVSGTGGYTQINY